MLVAAPSRTCPPMTSPLSRGLTARTRISAQRRPPSPQWSLSSLSSSKRHFRAWDIASHRIASTNTTLQFEPLPLNHPTRTRPPTVYLSWTAPIPSGASLIALVRCSRPISAEELHLHITCRPLHPSVIPKLGAGILFLTSNLNFFVTFITPALSRPAVT